MFLYQVLNSLLKLSIKLFEISSLNICTRICFTSPKMDFSGSLYDVCITYFGRLSALAIFVYRVREDLLYSRGETPIFLRKSPEKYCGSE